MRYHFPISIDMYDFLSAGRFDYLEIGQTAEMILQMFPAPECVPEGLLVKKRLEHLALRQHRTAFLRRPFGTDTRRLRF